ncbi:MAG: IPT/TIG domain-containing protein [Acidobacteriota bacterium]|nr:MAG: IPT/TIG domain-containing protein [Acidobacteriota bacterium]
MDFAYDNTTLERNTTLLTLTDSESLSSGEIFYYETVDLTATGDPVAEPRIVKGQGFFPDEPPVITSFSPANSGKQGDSIVVNGDHFDPVPKNNIVEFAYLKAEVTGGSTTALNVDVPSEAFSSNVTVTRADGERSNLLAFYILENDEDFTDITSIAFNDSDLHLWIADRGTEEIFDLDPADPLNPVARVSAYPDPFISEISAEGKLYYSSGSPTVPPNPRNVRSILVTSPYTDELFASTVDAGDGSDPIHARGLDVHPSENPVNFAYLFDGFSSLPRRIERNDVSLDKNWGNWPGGFLFPDDPAGTQLTSDGAMWMTGLSPFVPGDGHLWISYLDGAYDGGSLGPGVPHGLDWNEVENIFVNTLETVMDAAYAENADRYAFIYAAEKTKIYKDWDIDIVLTPLRSTRVLISRLHGLPYPSTAQSADGQVTIKVITNPPLVGETVYLRIIDPPDTALYGTPSFGDNNDKVAGEDAGSFSAADRSVDTTSVVTGADGTVEVTLYITDRYAGDNYKIQASFEPFAGDDPPNPGTRIKAESGTITAWKRIYVERDDMYRRGGMLFSDFTPDGDSLPDTIQVETGHNLIVGDGIDIFDADHPVEMFAHEAATIQTITPDTGFDSVALDVDLQQGYNAGFAGGDKGAGVGVPSTGFYKADAGLLHDTYGEVFVEYLFPDAGRGAVPYRPSFVLADLTPFRDIWFSNQTKANYLFLVGGTERSDNPLSKGTSHDGKELNFVWIKRIEASAADAPAANRDVVCHEFGHQFGVNPEDSLGHDLNDAWCIATTCPTELCVMNESRDAENDIIKFDHSLNSDSSGAKDTEEVRGAIDGLPPNN